MIDRRSILLAAVALAAVPSVLAATGAVSFDQAAYDAALAEGRPMLVEISAPWCPTCKAQKAVLGPLLSDSRYAGLVYLDVDFDTQKDVVRALGARQQSTLIVYSGGAEIARSVGETDPATLKALVDSAL